MSLPRSSVRSAHPEPMPTTSSLRFIPPPISRVEDTGLSQLWLQDLALKILYFRGYLTGFEVAEAMSLPFAGLGSHAHAKRLSEVNTLDQLPYLSRFTTNRSFARVAVALRFIQGACGKRSTISCSRRRHLIKLDRPLTLAHRSSSMDHLETVKPLSPGPLEVSFYKRICSSHLPSISMVKWLNYMTR